MSARTLLFIAALAGALYHWQHRTPQSLAESGGTFSTFPFASSARLAREPLQRPAEKIETLKVKDYSITPLAEFQLAGRVLGTKRYRVGREADLSPIDFALGWGPMTDPKVIEKLNISQSARFYSYRYRQPPIPPRDIVNHSANMHLIPATPEVAARLFEVRPEQHVKFKGYLVKIEGNDGWEWKSSLTRNDSGAGACELVVVDTLEIL